MSEFVNTPQGSLLGKVATYVSQYQADLLFPIPRVTKREEIGLVTGKALPFIGVDIWNAYELSWLNARGKPVVALMRALVPCESPAIIESKSFKLYLNSFNMSRFDSVEAVQALLQQDLSAAVGAAVSVKLMLADAFGAERMQELSGLSLDRLDIECDRYQPAPEYLRADFSETPVSEVLTSNLLKSNCLVTGQPDWGSVQISYTGAPIHQEGLLKYIISFRDHHEFHEQCVERMFMDIWHHCQPQKLTVYARYTRRGGLDINPLRSNHSLQMPAQFRQARQ